MGTRLVDGFVGRLEKLATSCHILACVISLDNEAVDESKGGENKDDTIVAKDDDEEEFEFHINGSDESIQ